jgi:transcriptional regulator with XRE-family HTH domain
MRYGSERPTLYARIGEQIMLARRRAGLTQRQLGVKLGISHVAVGDIERAKSRPDLDNLAVIADVLDVPLCQIVALERRRRPTEGQRVSEHPHIPPHIREWMQTPDGYRRVTEIVLDALNDTTNVVTNTEVREIVEEAYRRQHGRRTVRPEPGGDGGEGEPCS